MKIDIGTQDFGTLCICALRYCQGRRTYMPSLVQKIVGCRLKLLSDNDIAVLLDDAECQERWGTYGDECDKQDWLKFWDKVKAEQERRHGSEASE